jgi:hypothetical protein
VNEVGDVGSDIELRTVAEDLEYLGRGTGRREMPKMRRFDARRRARGVAD